MWTLNCGRSSWMRKKPPTSAIVFFLLLLDCSGLWVFIILLHCFGWKIISWSFLSVGRWILHLYMKIHNYQPPCHFILLIVPIQTVTDHPKFHSNNSLSPAPHQGLSNGFVVIISYMVSWKVLICTLSL